MTSTLIEDGVNDLRVAKIRLNEVFSKLKEEEINYVLSNECLSPVSRKESYISFDINSPRSRRESYTSFDITSPISRLDAVNNSVGDDDIILSPSPIAFDVKNNSSLDDKIADLKLKVEKKKKNSFEEENLSYDDNMVEVMISVLRLTGLRKSQSSFDEPKSKLSLPMSASESETVSGSFDPNNVLSAFVRFSTKANDDRPSFVTHIPSDTFKMSEYFAKTVLWPVDDNGVPSLSMNFFTYIKNRDNNVIPLSEQINLHVGISLDNENIYLGTTKLIVKGKTEQIAVSLPVTNPRKYDVESQPFYLEDDAKLDIVLRVESKYSLNNASSAKAPNIFFDKIISHEESEFPRDVCEVGCLNDAVSVISESGSFRFEDDESLGLYMKPQIEDEISVATPSGPLFYHVEHSEGGNDNHYEDETNSRYVPTENSLGFEKQNFLVEVTTDGVGRDTISSIDSRVSLISLPNSRSFDKVEDARKDGIDSRVSLISIPSSRSIREAEDSRKDEDSRRNNQQLHQESSSLLSERQPNKSEKPRGVLQQFSCYEWFDSDYECFDIDIRSISSDSSFTQENSSYTDSFDLNELTNITDACDGSIGSNSARSILWAKKRMEYYATQQGVSVEAFWKNDSNSSK